MSDWLPIETVDLSLESVDLFGHIQYDLIEMRLTDCEFIDDKWHYFCAGELLPCDGPIGFTPTHWMPLPEDPK
jgi:hypothetical protein